jgi:hypothetical protein
MMLIVCCFVVSSSPNESSDLIRLMRILTSIELFAGGRRWCWVTNKVLSNRNVSLQLRSAKKERMISVWPEKEFSRLYT